MILSSLVPIFLIILCGLGLKRTLLRDESVWAGMEQLTYYLFFPALLLLRLSASSFDAVTLVLMAKVVVAALFLMSVWVFVTRKLIASHQSTVSSIYQGSVRFNTYIGLAVIESLFGEGGLVLAALCLAIYVPLVNALSVVSLSFNRSGQHGIPASISLGLVRNPLVIACLLGILLSFFDVSLPPLWVAVLGILSQPALPLGLLAVGAGIGFRAFGSQAKALGVAIVNKLVLIPAIVLGISVYLGVAAQTGMVLLLLTALPAPPSAYILAKQLGGDAPLMANIITAQTLLAFLMIPVWLDVGGRFL